MIGFFDSGIGGLSILREATCRLPQYSYLYFADQARAPYGNQSADEIYQFTEEGVNRLFQEGCELVILACNTASAVALRRLQQEFLPQRFPDRRVLGIVQPTVEELLKYTKSRVVGLLATSATVRSGMYEEKLGNSVLLLTQACPLLVPIIESGSHENNEFREAARGYIQELLAKDDRIDTVILGCTHYGLVADVFREFVPPSIYVLSQGELVISSLFQYLKRHEELEKRLKKEGRVLMITTGK